MDDGSSTRGSDTQGMGPGLLETVYEVILANSLKQKGLQVERQVTIPIKYQGLKFEEGFRADMVIENKIIVELKCVERLNNAHKKQSLTKRGITRIANRLLE